MEMDSASLVLCEGNPLVPGRNPLKGQKYKAMMFIVLVWICWTNSHVESDLNFSYNDAQVTSLKYSPQLGAK